MIWNSWARDPRIRHLEYELTRRGVNIIKMNDYVRVGSTSKSKLFSIAEFEHFSEEVCRTIDAARKTGNGNPPPNTTPAPPKSAEELIRQMMVERDTWRRRATEAETKLTIKLAEPFGPDRKFLLLKRLISRALHPDATSNAMEKVVRAELFKEIWPQVLKIEEA
jgi:hypothetical protein